MTFLADDTSTVLLASGDSYYLGPDGTILVNGNIGVLRSGGNSADELTLVVEGRVVANVTGFGASIMSGVNFLTVGASGSITAFADGSAGIRFDSASVAVNNWGVISGEIGAKFTAMNSGSVYTSVVNNYGTIASISDGDGIYLSNTNGFTIDNHGTVSGGVSSAGIHVEKTVNPTVATIHNYGTVSGGTGVLADGGAILSLRNDGQIGATSSADYGVDGSDSGGLTINNHGVIFGESSAILGSSSVDTIVNSGRIEGAVMLDANDDFYTGRAGGFASSVQGGAGLDTLIGSAADDRFYGDADSDMLRGGAGDDSLHGGADADTLVGGKGDDDLFGDAGADIFAFGRNAGDDFVHDFEDGSDKIDLQGFGFATKKQALSHFFEVGSANNDKVGFEFKGTFVLIKGVDLGDIGAGDLVI
ncbi:MAG: M10 family metallopeptidase C-terminal domain-containing protein [Hyphomicrobiaceae bacterium]|nr:M10 family metallopeptidase C-terminal domain-containing protein [Hyphomicrobiaceae bacterium]